MSQQFKPRVSILQPAEIFRGESILLQDQDHKYFLCMQETHWQYITQFEHVSEVSKSTQLNVHPFLDVFFTSYHLQYKIPHKEQKALLQVSVLAGFILWQRLSSLYNRNQKETWVQL